MSACKTLIRASLSCLEFRARTSNWVSLRRFSSSLLPHSGVRIKFKSLKPFSSSRSFGRAAAAAALEIPDRDVIAEAPASKGTVGDLLSIDKDDISRLMKMKRREGSSEKWFPYLDEYEVGDTSLNSAEILEAMEPCIMETRKERFRTAVNNRSYSVCLVVEGLTDFGNVSAAFRSADALGVQSVHVVSRDGSKRYKDNRHVSMGAEKWLDIELWDSVKECFGTLKRRGYRIATAHLGMDAVSVYDVDWSQPTAIVVGNEHRGICEEALELSDLHCCIPMRGMVDSFNVSVAAGLLMHQAVCDRTLRLGCHGDLTEEERRILLAEFYLRHNKNTFTIATEYSKRKFASPVSKL